MKAVQDEETVAQLFRACELHVEPYPRSPQSKTPDLRVTGTRGELFFCEVKSVCSEFSKPVSHDCLYGAITDDVATAVKQFAAVNHAHIVPNVLAWVTHNPRYSIHSFIDLLRGAVVIDGQVCADLRTQRFGRFAGQYSSIDLFIWVHAWGAPEVLYNRHDQDRFATLCRLLDKVPSLERSNDARVVWTWAS